MDSCRIQSVRKVLNKMGEKETICIEFILFCKLDVPMHWICVDSFHLHIDLRHHS